MASRELRLDRLVNRKVVDVDGRVVGRIEEVRAAIALTEKSSEYRVTEYLIGSHGPFIRAFARLLNRSRTRYVVPWHCLDLRDPARPRIARRRSELTMELDDS